MASIIETIYDGGADKALEMSAGEAVRKLTLGTDWNHLCIAVVFTVGDVAGLAPGTSWRFRIGLTTNLTRLTSGTCPHAIHGAPHVNAWTYNAGSSYASTSSATQYTYGYVFRNGTQYQTAGVSTGTEGMQWSITGNAYRSVQLMSFYRVAAGALRIYSGTQKSGTPTSDHLADGALNGALLAGSMYAAAPFVECFYHYIATNFTVTEATYGNLDTVSIVWPYGDVPVRIHAVKAAKWS